MSGLSGALCVGSGPLFESTDPYYHEEAAAICAVCPVIEACRELLRAEQDREGANSGGPVGTWAGELVGTKRKYQGKPREHGSAIGYYQHRNRKEPACEPCLEAMRYDTWFRRKYGKAAS